MTLFETMGQMDSISIGLWVTGFMLLFVVMGVRVAFAAAMAGFIGLLWIFTAKMGFERGFLVAMKTFDMSRPGVAAQAVGIAQGAIDLAVKYARERVQFGKPISSFQGIQFMLADMATQTEAARALIYSTARMVDNGYTKIAKESAMAKLFAGDVAMKVTTDAVQIFGGYGYMRDYPIEKFMRDAKITQIYEGTNQIQRSVIAANLIKESASK